jgi:dCMP deaminase
MTELSAPLVSSPTKLPEFPEYYMTIAFAVRRRANCKGYKVGAALVVANRIVSTGYNGVPEGMPNCLDGGCDRCSNAGRYASGEGYDVCICVHAEENALLTAARFGISVERGTMYTTVRPCFTCMKSLHQAGVTAVRYHKEWIHPDASLQSQYRALESKFMGSVKRVEVVDPDDLNWIYPKKPPKPA